MKNRKVTPGQQQPATIDWDEVRRRLHTAQAAVDQALTPSSEEKRRILKARARELACDSGEKKTAGESIELVELLLGEEKYGIESGYVREVYPLKELTRLPGTPSFVLGIMNVRGQVVSVVDLKRFFDLPERAVTENHKIIIIHNQDMEFGILADAVLGAGSIPLEEIRPPLPTLTGIRAEYLRGVTNDRMVVLDAEGILSDRKIVVHEEG